MTVATLLWMGLGAALLLFAMLAWSIAVPQRRFWRPRRSTPLHKTVVWSLTVVIYASAILLGIIDWTNISRACVSMRSPASIPRRFTNRLS